MERPYTTSDLYFDHYLWNVNRSARPEAYDLDKTPLDVLEGHEVVAFANTFLELYVPGHTAEDLHSIEHVLLHMLPSYIVHKCDVANWLAKNLKMLEIARRTKMYKV